MTISFDRKPRGYFTIMGNRPEDAARSLADAGAAAVGTNCSLRIGDMIEVVEQMKRAAAIPIIAQPNAGNPEIEWRRDKLRRRPGGLCRADARPYQGRRADRRRLLRHHPRDDPPDAGGHRYAMSGRKIDLLFIEGPDHTEKFETIVFFSPSGPRGIGDFAGQLRRYLHGGQAHLHKTDRCQ